MRRSTTWVLVLTSIASLMVALDTLVVSTAGANSMLRELGGVFGIAIVVAVFAGAGGYASAQAFSDGFVPAVAVAAALSLAGALASLAVPGRARPVPCSRPELAPVRRSS